MNRRSRKSKLVAEINITPFTDVILVLLIIFMISTPLIYQTSIKVRLPESRSGTSQTMETEEVTVTITREGPVYLDRELVTRKELKEKLISLHQQKPRLKVLLSADQMVPFQDVVQIWDTLTEVGIASLDISSIKRQ